MNLTGKMRFSLLDVMEDGREFESLVKNPINNPDILVNQEKSRFFIYIYFLYSI